MNNTKPAKPSPVRPIKREHMQGLFSVLRHPIEGFEETRFRSKGSRELAAALYALFFAVIVAERQWTGFLFNYSRVERLNILIMMALALGIPVLWIIANTAVCALTDGEGSVSDIFIVTAYALLPYILFAPAGIVLSNLMARGEAAYLMLLRALQIGWTGLLLFCGVMVAHQYTVKKTVFTILLTAAGMLIIVFLMFLAFALAQQLMGFARTLTYEIIYMK